jgi:hypothetical protein
MSDRVHVPKAALLLAQASEHVRSELIESIRPVLLLLDLDASAAARAEAAIAAVHRAINLPGNLPAVATVTLADELRRSIEHGTVPMPPRARLDAIASPARNKLDQLMVDCFRLVLASSVDDPEPEQHVAEFLADEALRVLGSHQGRSCAAWLCGVQHGAMIAEAAEQIGGGA